MTEDKFLARCDRCHYWDFFDTADSTEGVNGHETIGTCHRYPPQRSKENANLRSIFGEPPRAHSPRDWAQPIVLSTGRCGEFAAAAAVE